MRNIKTEKELPGYQSLSAKEIAEVAEMFEQGGMLDKLDYYLSMTKTEVMLDLKMNTFRTKVLNVQILEKRVQLGEYDAKDNGLKIRNKIRIFRIYILTELYVRFRSVYLKEYVLKTENSYASAERMSNLMNALFYENAKPSDFIYYEDEVIDELIDASKEYKEYLKCSSPTFSEKFATSLFKNIEEAGFHLKTNLHFEYQIRDLVGYIGGKVSKTDLIEGMRNTEMFHRNTKLNFRRFVKTFLLWEKTALMVSDKQFIRALRSK